jgi:hypothetical protein
MHQFSLKLEKKLQTDLQQHRSRTTKKNSNTDERVLSTLLGRSRGEEVRARMQQNPYANERASERARGSYRRVARGILIRVQDVAELAMTVAADTIHTAFFLGRFFRDQVS